MATLNNLNSINFSLIMSTRKKLVTAISLGITSFILLILTYTQITAIFETRRKIEITQKKVDQLNAKTTELQQLKFTPEYAQASRMSEVLPSYKPLLELLNNLNSVANKTNVSITEFQINPGEIITEEEGKTKVLVKKKQSAEYDQLNLELSILGELNQVKEFMNLIERVSPLTTITSLTIDRKTTSFTTEDQQLTRADLFLNTYYYTKPISSTLSSALPDITVEEKDIFQEILDFTPPEVESQTQIIGGNNTDLFGIDGLAVSDLEKQIEKELTFTE
ncbi:MAG: hypothetical protein HN981_01410 [Candidatus Pacebacteria bacterium]|jgi:hypothetical protein|nr:hypothetical protein [Candidatus Paceibacterota bacterium]MBT4652663.1 hypothetical protein [Candidatus Paceibacterota bacterium]MBT6755820.1 hypothetical protein [Candidatus Paceibacterota bacterium]MBT6921033.1 hypothetical protein [Candidatus Paceibacterota bacterium]